MTLAIVADATSYISLLFGGLFLWVSAPNWPPTVSVEIASGPCVVIAVLLMVSALCSHRVIPAGQHASRYLLICALAQAASTVGFVWLSLTSVPDPSQHAVAATVFIVFVYAGLHCGLSAVLAGYGLWRIRNGYVSARRNLDLRISNLWQEYSTIIGGASLVFPALLASLANGSAP